MEEAVLDVGTFDDNVVGERKATLKRTAGDTAVQQFGLRGVGGDAAGYEQRVVLDGDVEVLGAKASHRHSQAIGVVSGFFDVVGGIGLNVLRRRCCINQPGQPIEADSR